MASRKKGILAFSLRGPEVIATVIDALVRPLIPFAELKRDAVIAGIGPLKVPVASLAHLIAMNTGTGRGKDAIDIEEQRKIQAGISSC